MAYSIQFHPKAVIDYRKAKEYYEGINDNLVKRFEADFDRLFLEMEDMPKMFAIRYDGYVRIGQLKRYPYLIHYIVDDNKQQNILVAFLHEREDQNKVKNRY